MRHIRFGELRIGSVSRSSGVFAGSNKQHGFKSFTKENQAFGSASGERSLLFDVKSKVKDADQVDAGWDGKKNDK
ncbi:hypothetical protein [Cohnella nanjingensis]|uniref:Uncharacterized protein n=1 Tax=Cohnella nanjingensis TaxID=1387779 RepID=A0A7X0VE71_9BACL|nr:hypothetical protein [Cohnella nanjingensis]MBB6669249.1 hypothetical protein [Cohnella nanjingensis]